MSEHPGYVLHCTLLDAMKMFVALTGHEPTKVELTTPQSELLRDWYAVELPGITLDKYLGMETDWEAKDFKLS